MSVKICTPANISGYFDKNGASIKEGDILLYQPSSMLNPKQLCSIDLISMCNGVLCAIPQVSEIEGSNCSNFGPCVTPVAHEIGAYPMLPSQKQIRAVAIIGNINTEAGKSMLTPAYMKKLFGIKTPKK